jgi:mycobactin peptide synthetase MbtE
MNRRIIYTVFEQNAILYPERLAVVEEHKSYTYGRLKESAETLSLEIVRCGKENNTPVVVLLPPGFQLISSLLGVFRSGQIYLPLDPSFRPKRLRTIFDQARPGVCITNRAFAPVAASVLAELELYNCRIIVLEDLPASPAPPEAMPEVRAGDANYIFYSSGTTGEAKAILGCHDSLSHFIHWEIGEFNLDSRCRVSQLSQHTFDASLRDIFVPLAAGGAALIPPAGCRTNIPLLVEWLERQEVTLVHCVPSVFRLITRELMFRKMNGDSQVQLPKLQHLLLAGEQLFGKDIADWRSTGAAHVELVNLYGTSETTMAKTFHRICNAPGDPSQAVHVGRPISNTVIAIIHDGNLCKPGEIGEIYIITPFMTLGYYRNEELTRLVFVQNPLVKDRKEIVYRTGDYGIYLDDGSVEVIGRTDDQVKVNGIRVEPGEVKHAVLRMQGITDAEIIAIRNTQDENELVCYYIAPRDMEEDLREYLTGEINSSLLPVAFIRMEEFPLTINGKINRKALPRIGKAVISDEAYVPSMTPTELRLEGIWKEILSLDRIGTAAEFLRIGGASLKLIKMVSRIYHEFNVSLTFADVFANQTIGRLAICVDQAVRHGATNITPLALKDFYDVTHAQRRLWIHDQISPKRNLYNIVQAFELEGEIQPACFLQALAALSCRHEILRTVFADIGGEPKQRVLAPEKMIPAFLFRSRAEFPAGSRNLEGLLQKEQAREFNLETGPLFVATLCETGSNRYSLIINWHHIISDGWSQDVLLNDLLLLYKGLSERQVPQLQPLRFQYKDYADWANKRLQGEHLVRLERYWISQFNTPFIPAVIPYSIGDRAGDTERGDSFDFVIDEETAATVLAFARQMNVTNFVVLFAAVQVILNRCTGNPDIVTGSPFSGRNTWDTDGQVGLYVNLLPLRVEIRDGDDFTEVVENCRDCITGAQQHQDYPIDMLIELLEQQLEGCRILMFNVLVQSQDNLEPGRSQLKGVTIREIELPAVTCKADITFNFQEKGKDMMASLEYDARLYDKDHIKTIMANFCTTLRLLTAQPGTRMRDISIYSPQNISYA